MTDYTQEELRKLSGSAINDFKESNKELINSYPTFLHNLLIQNINSSDKVDKALAEKERIEHELNVFIYTKYPKTDEVRLSDGRFLHTLETGIFLSVSQEAREIYKKFQLLYENFYLSIFP